MLKFLVELTLSNGKMMHFDVEARSPEQAKKFGVRTMMSIIHQKHMQCKIVDVSASLIQIDG